MAGQPALWAVPHDSTQDPVILCLHGGGFVSGSTDTHRKFSGHLAKAVGARALLADYRWRPANPHPAPLEDMTTAYQWLLDQGSRPSTSPSPATRLARPGGLAQLRARSGPPRCRGAPPDLPLGRHDSSARTPTSRTETRGVLL